MKFYNKNRSLCPRHIYTEMHSLTSSEWIIQHTLLDVYTFRNYEKSRLLMMDDVLTDFCTTVHQKEFYKIIEFLFCFGNTQKRTKNLKISLFHGRLQNAKMFSGFPYFQINVMHAITQDFNHPYRFA